MFQPYMDFMIPLVRQNNEHLAELLAPFRNIQNMQSDSAITAQSLLIEVPKNSGPMETYYLLMQENFRLLTELCTFLNDEVKTPYHAMRDAVESKYQIYKQWFKARSDSDLINMLLFHVDEMFLEPRRLRMAYSEAQKMALEAFYKISSKAPKERAQEIGYAVNLTQAQVVKWFSNTTYSIKIGARRGFKRPLLSRFIRTGGCHDHAEKKTFYYI